MHEIICPHCHTAFKIDEAGYADILKQVRDNDFELQLHERLELAEQEKKNAIELAKTQVGSEMQKAVASKEAEIQELKAKLDSGEIAQKLAVTEALRVVEKERDALTNELEKTKQDSQAASVLAETKFSKDVQEAAAKKDAEIQELKANLSANEIAQKLAITEAVTVVEKERDDLKSELKQTELEKQLSEKSLKDKYETQVKDRDDAIERLRDMKRAYQQKWLEKLSNSIVRLSSTEFVRQRFQELISRRIMMQVLAVRAIIFFATRMRQV